MSSSSASVLQIMPIKIRSNFAMASSKFHSFNFSYFQNNTKAVKKSWKLQLRHTLEQDEMCYFLDGGVVVMRVHKGGTASDITFNKTFR